MNDIRQQIQQIASSYSVFQCMECADAVQAFLTEQNISGKRIWVDIGFRGLPWAVIYDLKRKQQIATNGRHEGIVLLIDEQEIVFDNLEHVGVPKEEWLRNLTSPTIELGRGQFVVSEQVF